MSASAIPLLTPEEYLAIERAAEFKSEYYNGHMYAMSGGTYPHALIIGNLTGLFCQSLRGTACSVTPTEARLRVAPNGLYTYPDVMIVCGAPQFADDQRDTLLNPILIAEVLSKSTEAQDRGFKFAQYRLLESLQEYMLVSQSEARVEIYRRQSAGEWVLSESVGLAGSCSEQSAKASLALSEIYANISGL
ncbi:MAG: Uma2 family endonuclease [Bryobacterales bacterium]|nr:Uma2 family endonuclease [Bryobacterales bacterium]